MKLKDYISKNKGKMVKVGMGSGFFFMGRIEASTDDYISSNDKSFIEQSEKRQKNREKEIKTVTKLLEEYFKLDKKEQKDMTLRNLCDRYVIASDGILKEKVYRKAYTPLLEREILQEYPSIQTNETYIFHVLILDGEEQGNYWLWDEWKSDHKD